jgi:hypothetical protein
MSLQSILNLALDVGDPHCGLDCDIVDHAGDAAELADRILGATLLKILLNFTR